MKKEKATIEDFARMCNKMGLECKECPLSSENNCEGEFCDDFIIKFPDKANEIILKWGAEHPVKTRQEKFLEMFPNADVNARGVLEICPFKLEKEVKCRSEYCEECRQNYWSEEVEE